MASKKAIEAGKATIRLSLSSDAMKRELRRLSKQLSSLSSMFTRMGSAATAAGASVVGAFAGAAKTFAGYGDQLQKMSARTGASAESLSQLKFAAEQSGTSIESVSAAMFRARRRIANATTETGPAARAMKELGLNVKALNQLSAEDQFLALTDALKSMEDQNRAAQLGFEIFGNNLRDIKPLLNAGSAGIRDMMRQADQLGLTLSTDDANAAAALTDALHVLTSQFKSFVVQIGAAVAGDFTRLLSMFESTGATVIAWVKANRPLIATALKVGTAVGVIGAALVGVGASLAVASVAIGGLTTVFGTLASLVMALVSPFGIVAAIVAGLAGWALKSSGAIGELADKFHGLRSIAGDVIGGITDALAGGDVELAGRVLWAGLNLLWREGTQNLQMWWINFSADMLNIFDAVVTAIKQQFFAMVRTVTKLLVKVNGFVSGGVAGLLLNEDAVAAVDKLQANRSGIGGKLQDRLNAREKERKARTAAVAGELDAAKKAFGEVRTTAAVVGEEARQRAAAMAGVDTSNVSFSGVFDGPTPASGASSSSSSSPGGLFDASRAASIFGIGNRSPEVSELKKLNESNDEILAEIRDSDSFPTL